MQLICLIPSWQCELRIETLRDSKVELVLKDHRLFFKEAPGSLLLESMAWWNAQSVSEGYTRPWGNAGQTHEK